MKTPFTFRRSNAKNTWIMLIATLFPLVALSAETAGKTVAPMEKPTMYESPVFIGLLCITVFLGLAILVFAKVARVAIIIGKKRKSEKEQSGMIKTLLLLLATGFSFGAFGQTDTTSAASTIAAGSPATGDYWGMDALTFYLMICFILFELFVIWQLYNVAMQQLGYYERREKLALDKKAAAKTVKRPSFIEKINQSVAIEKEAEIMLDHNYDGIRELDNDLPPWWKYGFYMTIVFSFAYMIHYHVTHTGKLQNEEYEQELLQAKYDLIAYRKKAANLVDENNATILTDASALASGKALFITNCAACHGTAGEGGVGPNLTDNYWMHGGDVKEVFKTIKYGYPEKGMKSWQQDLGAKQIHEISSFIKSIEGTNPPNAKEPQGELYVGTTTGDSTGSDN
ncbi:MAG: cbb3-type cytochrome c oxidase N-terminal domain-containing protein [Bacteroidota bacterium]